MKKTHFIIYCNRGKSYKLENSVMIAGSSIEQVHQTKFLGMIIDKNLTWRFHVDHVCSKISKNIGIWAKCRKIFSQDTLITLYNSFIMPYIYYGIHVWGATYPTYLLKVITLQKKGCSYHCRCTPTYTLFNSLGILTLKKLYI